MELINCNYDLHYWNYDTDFHLLETDWSNDLFAGAFFDFIGFKDLILKHLSTGNHHPLILEAESNLLWIAGIQSDGATPSQIYLIGPIFSGRDTQLLLWKKLDSYELSVSLRANIQRTFENIPTIPSNILMQYAVMLHYSLNQERISINDILLLNTASFEQSEHISLAGNSHAGIWMNEQFLCKMFAAGDPRYKEAIQKSFSLSHGVKAEVGDALRSHKNNCLVLLTLCSRACISGGLSPDIGYDLNDYYAQKIEYCKSLTDANKLCAEMLEDYVSRVQELKKNPSVSNLIRNTCEYIKSHLTEDISIQELAKRTGYTEYYFSHKFKKELGCSVNEYILNEKIEQAKLLLAGTTESIQSISDNLAFSNRCYFYTCFQKITGLSPTEFRKQHNN
ncbi:MAG: helix-turn-helix domain-containing protein [Bacteroides fragilis]